MAQSNGVNPTKRYRISMQHSKRRNTMESKSPCSNTNVAIGSHPIPTVIRFFNREERGHYVNVNTKTGLFDRLKRLIPMRAYGVIAIVFFIPALIFTTQNEWFNAIAGVLLGRGVIYGHNHLDDPIVKWIINRF